MANGRRNNFSATSRRNKKTAAAVFLFLNDGQPVTAPLWGDGSIGSSGQGRIQVLPEVIRVF